MKKTPSPALIISILALFVALSGTTYAAVTINGKNIKKGTVTTKQIKNGTIKKADLSKKLSVVGPTGPQGAPGATKVVKHVWHSEAVGNNAYEQSRVIQCGPGETLTGGGAGWLEQDGDTDYGSEIAFSGPVDSNGDPATGSSVATGWTASGHNDSGGDRDFEVYALCATP